MDEGLTTNLNSATSGLVQDARTEVPDREAELKIWIIVRKDLTMSRPKMGAQTAHAAGTCMLLTERNNRSLSDEYLSFGQPKIVVGVDSEAELIKSIEVAKAAGLVTSLIKDAGRTEFDGETLTVGAVGPCKRSDLPGFVKRLRLLTV